MITSTRNDYEVLSYGQHDAPIRLVLPAGASIDDALSLASGMIDIVSGLGKEIAHGGSANNSAEVMGYAASWLAEIAYGIVEGVREDLVRIAVDAVEGGDV